MEIKGIIVKKLPIESGVSKKGKEWKKQLIIVERPEEKYNKEICIETFGDKIEYLNKFEVGDTISILANVFSREWNGKYFNSIQGYAFANKNSSENNTSNESDMPF
jgi:hypothetical protein